MMLLLDMGNSRLKSAVLNEAGELSQFVFAAYDLQSPIDTLAKHLSCYESMDSVTLVSVLGESFREQASALLGEQKIPLHWADSEASAYGVTNRYNQPKQLGSDRFVALVAARRGFPQQACIVIDCGTAVTIDALTDNGEFLGGVIIPGLKLWSDSLIQRADQLNDHQIQTPELFARDTAQAIGSGSVFGLTSAIDGICQRMSQELQQSSANKATPKLVICGGDAELVAQYSQLNFELIPHLVLMGLAEYT